MTTTPIRVALIGSEFPGRAHPNAWRSVGGFLHVTRPVMETVAP